MNIPFAATRVGRKKWGKKFSRDHHGIPRKQIWSNGSLQIYGYQKIFTRLLMPVQATGEILWRSDPGKDVDGGLSADIDPRYKGLESFRLNTLMQTSITYLAFPGKMQGITSPVP